MGCRGPGRARLPESVRERFWAAVAAGLSPTAAATVAGVHGATGRHWAQQAGYRGESKHFGIRYTAQQRAVFWTAVRSAVPPAQAAVVAGVSEAAARRWLQQADHVPRTPFPAEADLVAESELTSRVRAPLRFVERCRLEQLLEHGYPPAQAAALMGRHKDTINREIARGQTRSVYRASMGQDVADAARKRPKVRKLEANPGLRAEVLQRLETRNSPEQIAGRLRQDFPDDPEMWVSHETIYQAVYVQPRGELAKELKSALRTGRIKRKPQGRNEIADRNRFKAGMVGISERPAEADDRAIPGHWEGDLIMGAGNTSAIGTLVERTTGFVMLLHLPGDHTATTVAAAMTAKVPEIPAILRRSLTWDQGTEMAMHTNITEATGLPIYFCDPHSPWQRGTNENTNGLLRQYFPKGTDLAFWGPGFLDQVAAELNARPRKRHNWRTPAEELDRLLSDPSTYVAATA
ncbi:transposase, IS30 family [Mycolicibacterium chubuense NBB4]|uniref:Transposase, IS30 family n=1 Tax=Mycolicibacterium chubuense (strain NBB4) TaxID=710421 RepID=I4BNX0_MYCCN|nr:transposase, IS30 family [Mycolicibacterium chubuense NBB4]AFM18390.1 transposase, IS30 family [Mycolicibacterium chubuense NBB4]AFM18977.1 transposase, IS30 family [Mycolicibacterium chubuense NBB4]AFM19739.1 transposase, IS30 family [Mycolicibacterium chubuense NBB4]